MTNSSHSTLCLSLRIRAREEADGGATHRRLPPTERGFAFTTKCPRPQHNHKMTHCACEASITLACVHNIGIAARPHQLCIIFVLLVWSSRSVCPHGFGRKSFPFPQCQFEVVALAIISRFREPGFRIHMVEVFTTLGFTIGFTVY